MTVDGNALRLAAKHGHVAAVRACLSTSPQVVNEPDGHSYTSLHYAAFGGHNDVLEALIQVGHDNGGSLLSPAVEDICAQSQDDA